MKPMWEWRPAVLRRAALPVYLLWKAIWYGVYSIVYLIVFAAISVWEEARYQWPDANGWRGGWIWIRATWRGEHVGEALIREMRDE